MKLSQLHTFGFGNPQVLLVGSQHGNEPAGCLGLGQLIQHFEEGDLWLERGSLVVVPCANTFGLVNHRRGMGMFSAWRCLTLCPGLDALQCADMNRHYSEDGPCSDESARIKRLASSADFVIDFHEARDYHQHSSSLGALLIANDAVGVGSGFSGVAEACRDELNSFPHVWPTERFWLVEAHEFLPRLTGVEGAICC